MGENSKELLKMDHKRFNNEDSMATLPRPETPNVGYSGMEAEEIHADGRIILKDDDGSKYGRKGAGDQDDLSCWYRFVACIRGCWATRQSENAAENQELYIKTSFRELMIYLIFLALLVALCFIPANPLAFYFENNIEQTLLNTQVSGGTVSFGSAGSFDDIWQCLMGPLVTLTHQNQWYSGQPFAPDQLQYLNMESKLLGLVRLRQVRVDPAGCVVPEDFSTEITQCFPSYTANQESTRPFGLMNSTAWNYTDPSTLAMGTFVGEVATYGAGGYYIDLPRDQNDSLAVLTNLFQNLWLDRQTRALFITFSLYNPNLNLFAICKLVFMPIMIGSFYFEFPASGGLVQKDEVRIVNLLRYQSTKDYICMACEIAFLLMVLYYIIEEIIEIHKDGFKHLLKMSNVIDIIVILVSILCAGFSIYRTIKVNEILATLVQQQDFFPNFEFISYWEIQYNYAVALLLFVSWIKFFKFINFNRAMTLMSISLSSAMDDLISFIVMFAIVFFAYAQLGYLAFGSQATDMSSFSTACFSLLRLILNDFDFTQYKKANRILGPLYFVAFIVICFFILFNMFVAIISKTYEDVADEMREAERGYEFSDLVKEGLIKMKNKLVSKKKEIEDIQHVMDGCDSGDVLNINDVKTSLQQRGHLDKDIDELLVKYDVNDDKQLSYKERLKLQADLQERKIELIDELERDETVGERKVSSAFSPKAETSTVTMEKFKAVLKRVDRIESSINCIVDKLDAVITKLDTLEEARSTRKSNMTRILNSLPKDESLDPSERQRKMQEILSMGLSELGSQELRSRPSTQQVERK